MAEQAPCRSCRTLRYSSTILHSPAHFMSLLGSAVFQLCPLCSHSFHPQYTEAVCLQGRKIRIKRALQPSKGTTLCLCKTTGLLLDKLSSLGWRKSPHGPALPYSYFTLFMCWLFICKCNAELAPKREFKSAMETFLLKWACRQRQTKEPLWSPLINSIMSSARLQ